MGKLDWCRSCIYIIFKKTISAYSTLGIIGGTRKIISFIYRGGILRRIYAELPELDAVGNVVGTFGVATHDPMVSVIAVNYNGASHLPDFLDALSRQSYRNFELIIVDNGSVDNSEDVIDSYFSYFPGNLKLIKADKNLGFAEGNNVALDHAKGEYLALLNVDTRVDHDWIKEMVDAICCDGSVAIVASKILFYERFRDLVISSNCDISLNISALEESLEYKKYFFRTGVLSQGNVLSDKNHKITISIPVQATPVKILLATPSQSECLVDIKAKTKLLRRVSIKGSCATSLDFSIDTVGRADYIVNNAGSMLGLEGMPCDRGFGEYDNGQYDNKCYLPLFCGCAALIRRAAIIDRPIFIPEMFAYYEDSELSRWVTSIGHRIVYAPRALVYHRHSATSSEGSSIWCYLVQRSRSIYLYTDSVETLQDQLIALADKFRSLLPPALISVIDEYDGQLIKRLNSGEQIVPKRAAIGIYNSYWNTYGGGESHALSIASELQKYGVVELISETDFDIESLASYFSIDLSRCRKLVLPKISSVDTKCFFLFVNSTFCSNLPSLARFSWYIVSFPHRNASRAMLESYYFLFNSAYTKKWASHIWGNAISGDVIYPVRMLANASENTKFDKIRKKKIILSVGRFNPLGHSKNQHIIAEAYKALASGSSGATDWKLVLAGSLDYSQQDHVDYFEKVKSSLHGLNAEVLTNIDHDTIINLYADASLYVHATGFGYNMRSEPEKFEHFGISVVEAMQTGCIPVVFNVGGPADLVQDLGVGYTYHNRESLLRVLEGLVSRDFISLITECETVQQRGAHFIESELCKHLPHDAIDALNAKKVSL